MSFPELSFWLKRAVHPCYLGLNAQRINCQLWRAVWYGPASTRLGSWADPLITQQIQPDQQMQLSKKSLKRARRKCQESCPKASLPQSPDTACFLQTAEITGLLRSHISRIRHLASPVKQSCIWKPVLKCPLAGKTFNYNYRALHSYILSLVPPNCNYSAKWKSSQGETWDISHTHCPSLSSWIFMGYKRKSLDSEDSHPTQTHFEGWFSSWTIRDFSFFFF